MPGPPVKGRVTHAQEEPRTAPQGRRESHGPARARRRGASYRHHLAEAALLGAHNGNGSERLHREAPDEAARLLPKKDCEYCDHGARDVSSWRSDPKKEGFVPFQRTVDRFGGRRGAARWGAGGPPQ